MAPRATDKIDAAAKTADCFRTELAMISYHMISYMMQPSDYIDYNNYVMTHISSQASNEAIFLLKTFTANILCSKIEKVFNAWAKNT